MKLQLCCSRIYVAKYTHRILKSVTKIKSPWKGLVCKAYLSPQHWDTLRQLQTQVSGQG